MALVKLWNSWQNGRCRHQMSPVRLKSSAALNFQLYGYEVVPIVLCLVSFKISLNFLTFTRATLLGQIQIKPATWSWTWFPVDQGREQWWSNGWVRTGQRILGTCDERAPDRSRWTARRAGIKLPKFCLHRPQPKWAQYLRKIGQYLDKVPAKIYSVHLIKQNHSYEFSSARVV